MAKPVNIPNSFATSTSAIPLSYLDQDFNALANSTNDLATYSNYVADTGAANAYIANFPTNTNTSSLTAGLRVQFKAANANTGTSTLNVQVNSVSIGSGTIKLTDGSNLPSGAIVAGALVDVMYDGTNFQLLSDSSGGAEIITNLTLSGNLTFTGTGNRITGDFSNATVANRVNFQTSTSNSGTYVSTLPSGTGNISGFFAYNAADGDNASLLASYLTNSVAIINSSKNGTGSYLPMTFYTGGSERMRIDTSGNVGIGTSTTTDTRLRIKQSADTGGASFSFKVEANANDTGLFIGYRGVGAATAADTCAISASYGATGAFKPITFLTSDTERMRIDSSGNVGIGTSSPTSYAGYTTLALNNATSGGVYDILTNGTRVASFFSSDVTATLAAITSIPLAFRTNNTERMRIDSSGNVGIGTTSPITRLHVNGASVTASGVLVSNQGTNVAVLSNEATWLGTGTSNNAVVSSFGATSLLLGTNGAERMRIDSSGNVGIGTASPTAKLQIGSLSGSNATYVGDIQINSQPTSLAQVGGLEFKTSTFGSGYGWKISSIDSSGVQLVFGTRQNSATWTEAMRIDSSGNVGIGTSSPGSALNVARPNGTATYLQLSQTSLESWQIGMASSSSALAFLNSGAERMRIDSSGNVLVGTTNLTQTTDIGTRIRASGAVYSTLAGTTNATETFGVYSTGAGAYRFYVAMNGTVYATSTTITGISDQRVKENIVDLDDGLDAVMALKPRKFDWKEGKGKDIKGDRGFIAQEFETVFPDMIEEWKDPAPEGEEPYKAVNANLIPVLVKAIQEQQTIITDLKARIETLEGK